MSTDLLNEIANNKFLLILINENEYMNKLEEIIKSVEKTKTRICYICLNKPYDDVVSDFCKKGIKMSDFFFIDVLSSHYGQPKAAPNCIFVKSPNDLAGMRVAIRKAIEEKKCSAILFDTISALLIYQQTSSVVNFTHQILADSVKEDVKKLFILLRQDITKEESEKLGKDIGMFADKTLDLK